VVDNRWVIENGLKPGEQIIVEGFQKLRPGAPINPQPWKGPSSNGASSAKK
jgi:membrane fusion protein (multidrug efflux system)